MDKSKKFFKIINVNRLADLSGIKNYHLYNNLKGAYNSLTNVQKTQIVNALKVELDKLMDLLGYEIHINRKKG